MTLEPGTRIGPYEVVSLLSEGGMGEVYRAHDARLNRAVAIKVIHERLAAGANAFRRFELEAKSAGMLNHPNILAIYDIGSHGGAPYIVSELLDGESLHTRLTRGSLAPHKAIEYALQIASGLAAAHAKGIIHRDLKPGNVFITKDGRAKILDFGLAKLAEPLAGSGETSLAETMPGLTESGLILGTVSYMSPEQIRGEATDARSDIFSFGAVLYEMLTGRRAFQGRSPVETMNATLTVEADMAAVAPKLPAGLELLVRHCLEKSPDDRFQSARDLGFQLSTLAGGTMSSARPALRATPRPRANMLRTGAVLVAVAVSLVAAFVMGERVGSKPPPAYRQLTFRRGSVMSARFSPDGATIVYGAEWEGRPIQMFSTRTDSPESSVLPLPTGDVLSVSTTGELAISLGRHYMVGFATRGTLARVPLGGGAAREILTDVETAEWAPDGRSLAAVHVVQGRYRLEYPIGTVLYQTDGWISHPRFSPDGRKIAFLDHPIYGDDRGGVSVVSLDSKAITPLLAGWASVNGVAWTPSGNEIWFTASEVGGTCELYAATLSGRRRLVTRAAGRLTLQDIGRDGRALITQGRVRIGMAFREGGSGEERDLSWLDAGVAASLTPDGTTLFFNEQGTGGGSTGYAVYTRKTDGAAAVRLGEGHLASLAPDGKSVAAILLGPQPSLELLPTGAGEPVMLERGPVVDYLSIAWFPDGNRVLFAGKEAGGGVRTYVQDVRRGPPAPISVEGVRPIRYSDPVSPDQSRIVVFDANERLVEIPAAGGPPRAVEGVEPGDMPIRWDAGGKNLFLYHRGGLPVRVYRLDMTTHRKDLIAQLYPSDPAGVRNIATVQTTADARFFAYSYSQALSDLYLVEQLR